MDSKVCSKCGKEKPLTDFYKDNRTKGGYAAQCKDCRRPHDEKYYKTHSEHVSKKCNAYRIKKWARSKAMNALNSHRRQGHTINISIDEVEQMFLTTHTCPICGTTLINDIGVRGKGGASENAASMDRKNNSNELNPSNIWVICYACNSAKRDKTLKEFVEYCRRVVDNNG